MKQSTFKIVFIFAFLIWASWETRAAIGPATPTDNVFTKIKKPESTTEVLPYDVTQHVLEDDNDLAETDNDFDNTFTEEPEKEIIDWALVPYVPFKRVELKPAPDHKIE